MNNITFEDLDDKEINEIENELNSISTDNSADIENDILAAESYIDILVALENLRETLHSKKELTSSDKTLIKIATEMAVSGSDANKHSIIPALEDYHNLNYAIESITETLKSSVKLISRNIGNVLKKEADNIQYLITLIDLQDNKLKKLKGRLNSVKTSNKKISFLVRMSKNTRYGEDMKNISGSGEYLSKYKDASNFSIAVLNDVRIFTESDLFSTIKTLVSPITGYSNNFKKMFMNLYGLLENIIKNKEINKSRNKSFNYDTYESNTMLGLSHIEIKIPIKNSFSKENIESMFSEYNNLYMTFVRDDKFSTMMSSDSCLFKDVDKKYINDLLSITENNINECKKFNTISSKLSTSGAALVLVDLAVSLKNLIPLAEGAGTTMVLNKVGVSMVADLAIKSFLSSYKLMLRTSIVIHNTTSSSFNFTRGNTAKALSICESAIKNLELIN